MSAAQTLQTSVARSTARMADAEMSTESIEAVIEEICGFHAAVCVFQPGGELVWMSAIAEALIEDLALLEVPAASNRDGADYVSSVLNRLYETGSPHRRGIMAWCRHNDIRVVLVQWFCLTIAGRRVHVCCLDSRDGGIDIDRDAFRTAFGLTQRETEVVSAMIRVTSLREIGRVMSVTAGTLRVHIRRIYQKTGARTQIELMNLLSRFRI